MITEVLLDEKVTAFRAQLSPGMFLEPSFPTIAGVNGNGAIVHYRYGIEINTFDLISVSFPVTLYFIPYHLSDMSYLSSELVANYITFFFILKCLRFNIYLLLSNYTLSTKFLWL